MAVQVLEGTWEEVSRHGDRLAGQRVVVIVLPPENDADGVAARPFPEPASPEEWTAAFRSWAHAHPPRDAAPRTDEDISRDSIYGDRLDRQR